MTRYTFAKTQEYIEWFEEETRKSQFQILKRLEKIENEGHFGHINNVGKNLDELKFNDGRRIYFTIYPETNVILLKGGNKNGQSKDIQQAKKIKDRELS